MSTHSSVTDTRSPLAPLTLAELQRAAERAWEALGREESIVSIHLVEPAKAEYLAWRAGGELPKRAAIVLLAGTEKLTEVEISLEIEQDDAPHITELAGVRAPLSLADLEVASDAVLADERVQAALRRRGFDSLDLIHIDVVPAGSFGHALEAEHRIGRAVAYVRSDPTANPYAHPIEHLLVYLDLDNAVVLEVEDGPDRPIPRKSDGEYRASRLAARTDLKPFSITQPEGVSFTIGEDNRIDWYRWSLIVGFDHREGLVLHDVRFDGRPVMHRASCAEMVVPYGEADPMHFWRNYFDTGEVGLGWTANSLALGCDCVGEITYLDGHFFNGKQTHTIPQAICVHEEDAGTLWKHTDRDTDTVERRRSRRLVINSMSTVGNYEYAFRWYFYLDGSISVEVELHGIVSTMAIAENGVSAYSNVVDHGLSAPHHQHLFCFRLDLDVDGPENRVSEINSIGVPVSEENPWGNAFASERTALTAESEARRNANSETSRAWRVESSSSQNGLGGATSYQLKPGLGTATLLAQPESVIARRAAFARHSLWVTQHQDSEIYPAGRFPYQNGQGGGLPDWTAENRSLENEDVVLWYTAGITHFVKPEDWPIMPVHKVGFSIEPVGFFDRNPTLDLPAPDDSCGVSSGGSNGATTQSSCHA